MTTIVNKLDFTLIVDKPQNLSKQQLQYFQKLLMAQGQLHNPSMEKIKSCPFLCLAYHNELPFGIGAIKEVYKTTFDKANVNELKEKYEFELGYIFVLNKKKFRGQGVGESICSALLNMTKQNNIFATTEESEENPMKWILQKLNFQKTGQTYIGTTTKKKIGLYLLTINDL